jgi:hypothetical protein
MKKIVMMITAIALLCLFVGCATLTVPVTATGLPIGSKVGQASGRIWMMMFGTADAGIQAAAKNGEITKISTIDITTKMGIFGLWVDYEVTITGE